MANQERVFPKGVFGGIVMAKKKEDISEELMAQFAAVTCNVVFYEDKVDEYLKKIE
jgi:hypothetical protein